MENQQSIRRRSKRSTKKNKTNEKGAKKRKGSGTVRTKVMDEESKEKWDG